jgi:biotin carboxylase
MPKTIVVLGGNQMACPAIARMRERGFVVVAVDGNDQAPARDVADRFIHQNFSGPDATAASLADVEFDGIMPLNDFAIRSAARIARSRNLPGWNEAAEACFTSKIAMKEAWDRVGLPTARWARSTVADLLAGTLPAWSSWPCVVKPAFSGGGSRGVFVAGSWEEARARLSGVEKAYLDKDVVIEEFIDGSEHTLEVLVCRGTPTLLSISDKQNYPGSGTVVQNLHFPGAIGNSHRAALEELVFAACRAMSLTDGTTHFEVLIKDRRPYLLEVGGRPGGGLNFHPICEISTGYDYPTLLATVLTGGEPEWKRGAHEHLAWHYFPTGEGVLTAVEGFEAVRRETDVVDAMLYEKVGEPRFNLRDDLARPGYVLVRSGSAHEARRRAEELVASVKFATAPLGSAT